MKLAVIALLCSAAALAGADAAGRGLRTQTSEIDPAAATQAELRNDDLGANEDFWGSWENDYSAHVDPRGPFKPCANAGPSSTHSGSGSGDEHEHEPSVGDDGLLQTEGLLQKAESVATAAIPFNIEHAESSLLLVGLVAAALVVAAMAALLVGVRRQQLSEPTFGPVELVSDLPNPMTASAGSEAGDDEEGDFAADDIDDEADTGATVFFTEEEKEEEEEVELAVVLA